MAERLPETSLQYKEPSPIGYNRSNTIMMPYQRHSMFGSVNKCSLLDHPDTVRAFSCPNTLDYLSSYSSDDVFSPTKEIHLTIEASSNFRNSETDSSLREDIVGLSATNEIVHTLTESLEDLFAEPRAVNSGADVQGMLSPTSQEMRTFRLPRPKHLNGQIEDSDLNSDVSTSREASPFNASDSSSMSASNSDFSSTELKDNKPKKAKESWLKVRRMIMWSPFVQIYKKKYPWIQLAGHHGNFRQGVEAGTILKKMCQLEKTALEKLNEDPLLKGFTPVYSGVHCINGEDYIEMQDLLRDFDKPSLMDIKIGLRTFHEDEIVQSRHKTKWRKDLYEKMCAIDSNAPTEEENELTAISKYRYMRFRESLTSTIDLGFRIEGMKNTDGLSKDFKTMKDRDKIVESILEFCKFDQAIVEAYIGRIQDLLARLEQSSFVEKNQLVGTSLLFVHSRELHPIKACVWMIDFGKTTPVPPRIKINHRSEWRPGNYEDGYLFGVENVLKILRLALSTLVGGIIHFQAPSLSKDKSKKC